MSTPPTSDSIFPESIYGKLYTERSILLGTFIGGPLAGAYLLAQNFKAVGKQRQANLTWLSLIGVLLFIFAVSLVPVLDDLPTLVYSFIFCMLAHTVARKFQGAEINSHRAQNGSFYSTGRAALVGVIALIIMVAVIVALFYLVSAPAIE